MARLSFIAENDCVYTLSEVLHCGEFELDGATSEQRLLHSYDRFYKAVNKLTYNERVETRAPLPSLESIMRDVPSIPEDRLRDLERVWERAETCHLVGKVVQQFHDYRSDLAVRVKQQHSVPSSIFTTEADDKMLEMPKHVPEAHIISTDSIRDQIPVENTACGMEIAMETDMNEESSALRDMVYGNQSRIGRMEQLLMRLDAKFNRMVKSTGERGETTPPKSCWPSSVHNNMVYSSSDGATEISDDQGSCEEMAENATVKGGEKADLTGDVSSEEELRLPDRTSSTITVVGSEQGSQDTPTVASTSITSPSTDNASDSGVATGAPLEDGDTEERFDEAFLHDALRVQQNILTSDLGNQETDDSRTCLARTNHSTSTAMLPDSSKIRNQMKRRKKHPGPNNPSTDDIWLGTDSKSLLNRSPSDICIDNHELVDPVLSHTNQT